MNVMASPPDTDSAGAQARLVAISGPLTGEVLPLTAGGARIGRDSANDICLPDLALSRTHCTISMTAGTWCICDSQSSNGTFVNGVQVTDYQLNDRDRITLGGSVFLFVLNAHPATIPPLLEGPIEPATRLPVEDTIYLRQSAELPTTARAEHDLRALLQISTTLNRIASEDELHGQVLELLAGSLPAEQVAVVVVGADGDSRIVDARQRAGAPSVPVSQTVVTEALEQRAGLLTCAGGSNGGPHADSVVTAAGESIVCVPMVVRDRALGALYLTTSRANAFDTDHLQFATAVANVAAIVLDNLRHVAWLHRERARLQQDLEGDQSLVGRSAAMQRIYAVVAKVARSDATVLITGETGTGKELIARAVHFNGARAKRPFVAINCAALTESLLETELFGHERGAFTGAMTQKKGKLEVADGGTVFLDEVGELAPALQSKLLRALELREFERVGGTRPVRVDIRLISATNRKLPDDVAAGRFRSDLYHRLHVVDIDLPPLRERRDDIPALANHFVERFARKSTRPLRGIAADALKYLTAYDWPGNVRELENTIERAIVLGASDYITRDDLPDTVLQLPASGDLESPRFHGAVRQAKVGVIVEAFHEAHHSYTEAARLLGLHPNYLHRLIRTLDMKSILEPDR
jgi:transcriptional regulator with GAF, ATPase, and Fis domain